MSIGSQGMQFTEPENKILEVAANIEYDQLQEQINQRYNGAMLLQYLDESDH